MQGLGILILIVLGIWLLWPIISRWLRRQAANRAEDFIRNATGMPPRPGSRREKKERKERENNKDYSYYGYRTRRHRHNPYPSDEPLIPKEYAEDVEFTETKDYSETTDTSKGPSKKEHYHESQVSDAEWTEIKTKTGK